MCQSFLAIFWVKLFSIIDFFFLWLDWFLQNPFKFQNDRIYTNPKYVPHKFNVSNSVEIRLLAGKTIYYCSWKLIIFLQSAINFLSLSNNLLRSFNVISKIFENEIALLLFEPVLEPPLKGLSYPLGFQFIWSVFEHSVD